MGTRENAAELDFSGVPLEEEVEEELKEAAVISMGTEISDMDLLNIKALCDQACTSQGQIGAPCRAVHLCGSAGHIRVSGVWCFGVCISISMGTDISDMDLLNIKALCDQVCCRGRADDRACRSAQSRVGCPGPSGSKLAPLLARKRGSPCV